MRKSLTSVIFILVNFLCLGQIEDESTAIKQLIDTYFHGQRTDNPDLIKSVFHNDSALEFISARNGTYQIISIEKYLTFFSNSRTREFESRIFYIDVTGTAANAKILVKYPDFQYTHYLNMLKTSDGWQIVSKISCQEDF